MNTPSSADAPHPNHRLFQFGTIMEEYPVPVVNEREIRAGAGLMFVIAFIAFMNAWLVGDFLYIKFVVVAFALEFFIRVLVNPQYAPFLVAGRLITKKQKPDFSGAPQKRFAWAIGLVLAVTMSVLVLGLDIRGPMNLAICLMCLVFLFCESAFGICVGCLMYNFFTRQKAQLCPGGACEIPVKYEIQEIRTEHWLSFALVVMLIVGLSFPIRDSHQQNPLKRQTAANAFSDKCVVPEFAKQMGHEEQWKMHNGCK